MILIPEIKILEIIDIILKNIEIDFNNKNNIEDTLLYRIFSNNTFGKFNFFEESKDLFLRKKDHPRRIETRMMFDAQRAGLPTIYITMPSENSSYDGIGIDQGYQEDFLNKDDNSRNVSYTRMFDATYHVIITSDNTLEVLLIYHLIKSMLISILDTIEFNGIRNPKFSGQDLSIQSELVPTHIFSRGIGISCSYESSIPNINREDFLNLFKIKNSMCNKVIKK